MYQATGALFAKKDVRDYKANFIAGSFDFPETYECPNMPEPVDQGSVNSCVACSLKTIIEWHSRRQGDDSRPMSIGYIYGNRENSTHTGEGMYTREAIGSIVTYGDCAKEDFPENVEVPRVIELFKSRVVQLIDVAYPNRITSYAVLTSDKATKAALMQNGPVVMAMEWFGDITFDKYYIMHTSCKHSFKNGGHCMVIYGWNKDGWLVQNSWGKDWQNEGRCIIPFDVSIRERYQIVDNFSEAMNKKRIEDLTKQNEELLQVVANLRLQITTLTEQLKEFNEYKELTQEQINKIDELSTELFNANNKLHESLETIENQKKEIEALRKELLEVKKPYNTPWGKLIAKIINFILRIFSI